MALAILDGNQTATTLSSVVSGGQHIPAHTVVSLGQSAISDIASAVSGSLVSVSNLPLNIFEDTAGFQSVVQPITDIEKNTIRSSIFIPDVSNGAYAGEGSIMSLEHPLPIFGTVSASISGQPSYSSGEGFDTNVDKLIVVGSVVGGDAREVSSTYPLPISGTVTIGSALPAGINRIGVVTIGAGTVTLGASIAQIGSVTASISGTVPVSGTFFQATQPVSIASLPSSTVTVSNFPATQAISIASVTIGNSITIGSCVTHGVTVANSSVTVNGTFFQATQPVSLTTLPALVAGTAQIGSVTASISNSVTIASFTTSVTARLINPAGTSVTYAEVGTAGNPSIDVLSVQGVTNGTLLPIQFPRVTLIDGSGSVTTANTAITVFASSSTRSYLLVQVTTGSAFVNVGATATTINALSFSSGQVYAWENTIPQGLVSIISTVTGSRWVAKEA